MVIVLKFDKCRQCYFLYREDWRDEDDDGDKPYSTYECGKLQEQIEEEDLEKIREDCPLVSARVYDMTEG
jgi:hypothetical protein